MGCCLDSFSFLNFFFSLCIVRNRSGSSLWARQETSRKHQNSMGVGGEQQTMKRSWGLKARLKALLPAMLPARIHETSSAGWQSC